MVVLFRFLILLSMIGFSGCVTNSTKLVFSDYIYPEDGDAFFASFEVTEKAFEGPVDQFTGYKYYINERPAFNNITELRYEDGHLVEVFYLGATVQGLNNINFSLFDYDAEEKRAEKLFYEDAASKGEIWVLDGRDGDSWKIKIQTGQGIFKMSRSASSGRINSLAAYNENINKLKQLINYLALSSGRGRLGFY